MYSLKNDLDIPKIMNYHRAKDMINIMRFFPGLSPVDDMVVILDDMDYLNNIENITHLTSIRNGNPVSEPCMKSIPTKEINPDYINIIKEIKKENKNGVLILFHLNVESTERYERYAGISIGVSLGNKIYIDAVGKGFDGREVLKGISCHERYVIPWYDIRKININNFKEYNTFMIEQDDYLKSRDERIKYLLSCGLSLEALEQNIPDTYQEIPRFVWLDVITNVIKKIEREEIFLREEGFLEFNLSGHTEGERFRPWQMVDDKRM